jgi:hypothetical protein
LPFISLPIFSSRLRPACSWERNEHRTHRCWAYSPFLFSAGLTLVNVHRAFPCILVEPVRITGKPLPVFRRIRVVPRSTRATAGHAARSEPSLLSLASRAPRLRSRDRCPSRSVFTQESRRLPSWRQLRVIKCMRSHSRCRTRCLRTGCIGDAPNKDAA